MTMIRGILFFLLLVLMPLLAQADTWYDTIKASTDDVEWHINATPETTIVLTNTAIYINPSGYGAGSGIGLRFLTCPIPAGATIDSIRLGFQSNAAVTNVCSVLVAFEDTADATTFSNIADLGARHWVSAGDSVLVENADANVRYYALVNPSCLQEVIDRGDWAANNDVAIKLTKLVIGPYSHKVLAYDYTTTLCAIIKVDYTISEESTGSQVIMIQ